MGKVQKIRLDELLVERGYFESADAALRAVLSHEVRVDDVYATSAAMRVSPDADIFVKGGRQYVSRGGRTLAGALRDFAIDVSQKRCIDVGSSTGGFTDCLLQAGAASVACVDVNYGQLAWSLREDPRVSVFERTNIRLADPASLGAPFDVAVTDVSFISLASLAPTFAKLMAPGGIFVGLIKPQFESAHEETEHGVVLDPEVRQRTVDEVCDAFATAGFSIQGVVQSSIQGPDGNVEFLLYAVFQPNFKE